MNCGWTCGTACARKWRAACHIASNSASNSTCQHTWFNRMLRGIMSWSVYGCSVELLRGGCTDDSKSTRKHAVLSHSQLVKSEVISLTSWVMYLISYLLTTACDPLLTTCMSIVCVSLYELETYKSCVCHLALSSSHFGKLVCCHDHKLETKIKPLLSCKLTDPL